MSGSGAALGRLAPNRLSSALVSNVISGLVPARRVRINALLVQFVLQLALLRRSLSRVLGFGRRVAVCLLVHLTSYGVCAPGHAALSRLMPQRRDRHGTRTAGMIAPKAGIARR